MILKRVIVSRHPGAVAFIRQAMPEFADAPVLAEVTSAEQIRGCLVAGNLPLHLAAETARVYAVEFAGAPPRGAEFAAADMVAAGATIREYVILSATQRLAMTRLLACDGITYDPIATAKGGPTSP